MTTEQIAKQVMETYFPKGQPISASRYIALCDAMKEKLDRAQRVYSIQFIGNLTVSANSEKEAAEKFLTLPSEQISNAVYIDDIQQLPGASNAEEAK